jgi:AraC family ethanolamine operon transcriptional activator
LKPNTSKSEYPVCADAGTIRHASFQDIDEQAAQLTGHEQLYQQISRGPFRGRFTTAHLGQNSWVFIEEINQTLLQQGSVPDRTASFMFLMNEATRCRHSGEEFEGEDLALLPPGGSFSTLCPPDTSFCVIAFDASALGNFFGADSLPRATARRLRWKPEQSIVGELRAVIKSSLPVLESTPQRACAGLPHLRSSLISTLALGLSAGTYRPVCHDRLVFRRAREFIHAHLREVTVLDLCVSLGIPRRTLETTFRRELGMGPAGYIRALRLNNIRREIIAGTGAASVADIAASWGIWHPSHFAERYAELFGELPSDTRRRSMI